MSANDDGTLCADMTIRQYAAIYLRVPASGIKEVDAMIERSLHIDFAKAALTGLLAGDRKAENTTDDSSLIAAEHAEAMLAELRRGTGTEPKETT